MNDTLLGCPHCAKPVGYSAAMAGQVVACPHCRGPFQMPDRPPSSSAPPLSPPVPPMPRRPKHVSDDPSLSFDGEPAPANSSAKAELDSYRAAEFLSTIFAIAGSAAALLTLGVAIVGVIVPLIRGHDDRPPQTTIGLLWLVASFLFASSAVVGLFMFRACALVLVDAARTLRAIERDTLATPKSK